jgi:cell division septum initiation protein DivIVA
VSDIDPFEGDEEELADLDQPPATQTEQLLRRLLDVVASARPVPLSTSAMINKDEIIGLVEEALASFPHEVKESRWLLKERDAYLAKAESEASEVLAAAKARSARMIDRSELVRGAEVRARQIVEHADADARRLRLEVEDYCDQKLGSFEIVLERTMRLVTAGREKLQLRSRNEQPNGQADGDDGADADADLPGTGPMFDQDRV